MSTYSQDLDARLAEADRTLDVSVMPTMQGYIAISTMVTDGATTWRHHERYMDYAEQEARELFAESLRSQGLEVAS